MTKYKVLVIKSRKTWWVRHVVRVGKMRGAYRVQGRKPKSERPLERPSGN